MHAVKFELENNFLKCLKIGMLKAIQHSCLTGTLTGYSDCSHVPSEMFK